MIRAEPNTRMTTGGLTVIETHPVQYHAPVYRYLQEHLGIPVTAIYGSDFSVAGYHDAEFGADFSWDTDLLSGYTSVFLGRVSHGGGSAVESVSGRGIAAALRRVGPGAVMVTGYSPRFHQLAVAGALGSGFPVLFRGETTDHTRGGRTLKRRFSDLLLQRIYRRSARLLYIGERSRAHFERLGCSSDKLVFSPYCVDVTHFACDERARRRLRGPARARLGLAREHKVLLFSGKLSPRKAPDLLLDAVDLLPAEVRERVAVLFLGDGELRGRLEARARSARCAAVRFAGFQNQQELSPYYQASDVLVLPSLRSETWGLVVNEALHHGLPCVVSDAVGCAPDLIEPGVTGETCEVGSADALVGAIGRALYLAGPEVRARARTKAEGYSLERAAQGIAGAFAAVTE